jgi:hypothetical protein
MVNEYNLPDSHRKSNLRKNQTLVAGEAESLKINVVKAREHRGGHLG